MSSPSANSRTNLRANLRERLRAETRPAHDALDRSLDLIERPLTRLEYTRLLARFYGFHQVTEPALESALDPSATTGRSKLPSLLHDLRACGVSEPELGMVALIDQLPPMISLPAALGALYVVEGSTLGGRLIGRHVKANPDMPEDSCRYFNVYGELTGERWRATCDTLEAASDPHTDDEAIETANAIFTRLHGWLMTDLRREA